MVAFDDVGQLTAQPLRIVAQQDVHTRFTGLVSLDQLCQFRSGGNDDVARPVHDLGSEQSPLEFRPIGRSTSTFRCSYRTLLARTRSPMVSSVGSAPTGPSRIGGTEIGRMTFDLN